MDLKDILKLARNFVMALYKIVQKLLNEEKKILIKVTWIKSWVIKIEKSDWILISSLKKMTTWLLGQDGKISIKYIFYGRVNYWNKSEI